MAKKQSQDPLDQIAEELVVFQHEDKTRADRYVSNDPRWNDSRIRERWLELYADSDDDEVDDEDEEVEEVDLPYEQWKNEDLRAELATRELSVEGTKADMAARLREDDKSQ